MFDTLFQSVDRRVAILRSVVKRNPLLLVVDDEPAILTYMANALRFEGYDHLLAEDGESGLAIFVANRGEIDLVISDVAMPRMSGPEMIREIRRLDPDVAVLLMTGFRPSHVVPEDLKTCRVLTKPFTPAVLFENIAACLDERARPSSSPLQSDGVVLFFGQVPHEYGKSPCSHPWTMSQNPKAAAGSVFKSGVEVKSAGSGSEALDLLAAGESFDSVLSDLGVPDMDGYELVRRVASSVPNIRAIPHVGLRRRKCEGCGMAAQRCALLAKPFTPKEAIATVE